MARLRGEKAPIVSGNTWPYVRPGTNVEAVEPILIMEVTPVYSAINSMGPLILSGYAPAVRGREQHSHSYLAEKNHQHEEKKHRYLTKTDVVCLSIVTTAIFHIMLFAFLMINMG